MSLNKGVSQVLVTSGDQAVAANGSDLSALAVGQVGIFDAETQKAINASATPREYFMAVGTAQGPKFSAGQNIQAKNVRAYNYKPYSASRANVLTLSGYKGSCDSDYALKINFENMQIAHQQGYNAFAHTFAFRTGCCDGCETCPTGEPNEVTRLLKAAINNAEIEFVSAIAVATEALTLATHGVEANRAIGDELTDADVLAIEAFNAAQADDTTWVSSGVQITSLPVPERTFCSINLRYLKPRQTKMFVSGLDYFNCNLTVTEDQAVAYEEGSGYDIQQLEYKAGSWDGNPGPYKVDVANGVAKSIVYNAVVAENYDAINLSYMNEARGNWRDASHPGGTLVAIPASDTTTRAAFLAILDAQVAPYGFDALADDAAASTTDETDVETDQTDALDGDA